MSHLTEVLPASEMNIIYKNLDLSSDDEEEMGDFIGYNGIKFRGVRNLEPYTYDEFVDHVIKDNKLPFILKSIRDIDQDNNGYVTTTELDDIIKLHYPNLHNKKLKSIFKRFASIQNRILIDYKSFRNDLIERIKHSFEDRTEKKDEVKHHISYKDKISPRRLKTKLNSLTAGSLSKLGNFKYFMFLDNAYKRTVKETQEDDVLSHVSISKASFYTRQASTARHGQRLHGIVLISYFCR
jgi:hypothetical protein